jgi:predicted glycoside hydrolase/deacetylase ChbG (UPF0249 family)
MKNNYIRTVELAQLNRNIIYLDDEDFGIKLNLLYMENGGVVLDTRYSDDLKILTLEFLLNYENNKLFVDQICARLAGGYTYFVTQIGNKFEYVDSKRYVDAFGNAHIIINFSSAQNQEEDI